mgnify:CR=1 FL=1
MKYFLQTLLLLLATAPGLASATIFLDDRNACQAISGIYRTTTSIADQVAECRLHESFTLPRDEYLEIASGYGLYVDSGATLTNQGRIRVYPRAKLQVDDGFLSNEELIENDGDVTVLSGFLFNNGTIENDRHINVLDRPNSSNSNVLLNKGPINLANDGQIRNEGIVFNDSGGQITSIAGSSIHNYGHYDSRDDRIAGTFTNYAQGVANVSRTLTLENAAVFRNEGSLVIARSSGALILNNGSRLDNVMTGQIWGLK